MRACYRATMEMGDLMGCPLRSVRLRCAMEALAEYFKVFSEPNRLAVLDALRQGPLNVTAVVERTGLSQALVSKHLKLLTIAGVVKRRPEGSLVFYDVIDRSVFKLMAQAEKQLLASRRQQLGALAAIL